MNETDKIIDQPQAEEPIVEQPASEQEEYYPEENYTPAFDPEHHRKVYNKNRVIAIGAIAIYVLYLILSFVGYHYDPSIYTPRDLFGLFISIVVLVAGCVSLSELKRQKKVLLSSFFSYSPRISRIDLAVSIMVVNIADMIIELGLLFSGIQTSGALTILVTAILTLLQYVKRLHDLDNSGWYIIIPIANLYYMFKCFFSKGDIYESNYGESPLYDEDEMTTEGIANYGPIYQQ